MNTLTSFRLLLSVTFIAISLMLYTLPAAAASCKGKTKSACSSATDCTWVDDFKRKDGIKVSAHCRSKSGKSGSSARSKKGSDASGKSNKGRETAEKARAKKESKKKTKSEKVKVAKEKVKKDKKVKKIKKEKSKQKEDSKS